MFNRPWSPSAYSFQSPTSPSPEDPLETTEGLESVQVGPGSVESSVDFERESQVPPECYEFKIC
jgi:hypothetical protein